MPDRAQFHWPEPANLAWLGRVSAVLHEWNPVYGAIGTSIVKLHSNNGLSSEKGTSEIITLLHRAAYSLRMDTFGPQASLIADGAVFDYFDEIRKIVEQAAADILFVDPYLDADFVSRYLPHVRGGVTVRLLAREKIGSLVPAVQLFTKQHKATIEVRSAAGFHDRFIFLDGASCYQSGASFKDGAKKAPATITQIVDAFPAMQSTYEALWRGGKVEL